MKRTLEQTAEAASDTAPHAKRPATFSDSFHRVLVTAGEKEYGEYLNFRVGRTLTKGSHLLVDSQRWHWHPPAGSTSRIRLVVSEDGSFDFQVLLRSKQAGKIESVDQFLELCKMMANVNGEFKFCPGIDSQQYQEEYFSKIRYDVKQLRQSDHPFNRVDSSSCLLFHKLAKNAGIMEKEMDCVLCKSCKRLVSDLNERLKTAVSSSVKVKRQQASSTCPLKFMSPTSQKKRKDNSQRERDKHRAKLQKYGHTEITLDDEQHDELVKLMEAIDEQGGNELETVLQDAECQGVGNAVREIWEMDKERMKEQFNHDQDTNCK